MYKKGLKKLMSCFLSAVTVCTLLSGISLPTYADEMKETVFSDDFESESLSTGTYEITPGKVRNSDGTNVQTDKSQVKGEGENNKALRLFSDSSAKFSFNKEFNKDDGVLHIQFDMKGTQLTPEGLSFKLYNENNNDYTFLQLGNNKLNPPASIDDWKGDTNLGKGITGYYKRTYDAANDAYKDSDGNTSYGEVYINGGITTDLTKYEQANVYNMVNVYVDLKNSIVGYDINGQSFTKRTSDFYAWKTNNKPELTQIKSFSLASHKRDKYMGANNTDYQLYYGDIYYDNVKAEIIKNKSLGEVMFTGVYDIPSFVDFDGFAVGKDGMINFPEGSSNIAHKGTLDLSFNQTYKTGRLYIGFDIGDTKDKGEKTGSFKSDNTTEYIIEETVRNFSVKATDGKDVQIAGIVGTKVGLQDLNSWQKSVGAAVINREKGKIDRIDLILDFDNKKISGYLNGVKLKAEQNMAKGTRDLSDLSVLLNGVKGFSIRSERETEPSFVTDNFKVTHFDEGFTAVPTVNATNKTVDIEFGTSLTDAEMNYLTGEGNASKWTVDNGITVTKAEKVTQSRIRLTVDKIDEGKIYTLTVPKVTDGDGNEQGISGVADKKLNADTIKYSTSNIIKNITFTGVDGKPMFLSDAEPGAKSITVDADFTPTSITLKKDQESVIGKQSGNILTLDNFLAKGSYTLSVDGFEYSFTVGEGSYTVSDYGFVDADGNALTDEKAMLNGGSYKFKVSAKNTTGDSTKSLYAIVAYYGENNKMIGVEKTEVKNAEGITDGYAMQSGDVSFSVPEGGSVKCIKAFMWDSLNTIKPIVKSVEVK